MNTIQRTNNRFGNYIFTNSGAKFYPLDPRPEDIFIEDIAHALSLICRFNGHCDLMYSVCQHSIHVSELCHPENALWGLLHDAAEIYLADIPRPLKRMLDDYKAKEKAVQNVICFKFGLQFEEPLEVKLADNAMLATEIRDLMSNVKERVEFEPIPNVIVPMSPKEAEAAFLKRFRELYV